MRHAWKWLLAAALVAVPLLIGGLTFPRAEAASTPSTGARIVPIVSLGTPGLRLGLAQVAGPSRQVKLVQAVLQLDADLKNARVKVLVPSKSLTSLNRVQETAVTAVVDYKLIGFGSGSKSGPHPTMRTWRYAPGPKPDMNGDGPGKRGRGHAYGHDKHGHDDHDKGRD